MLPLGSSYFYDYKLSKDKLVLTDPNGNVGVFYRFETKANALKFLEENNDG